MSEKKRFLTPPVRLSYPHLFRAEANKLNPNAKPTFSCSLIFDAEAQATPDFKSLDLEVRRLALEAFGVAVKQKDGSVKRMVPPTVKNPLRSSADKLGKPGYEEGTVFCSCNTVAKPRVLGPNNLPAREDEMYPGCWVRAYLTPATFNVDASKGVKFYLDGIKKIGEGERLGAGGLRPEDDFGGGGMPPGLGPQDEPDPQPTGGFGGNAVDAQDDIPFAPTQYGGNL